MSRPNEFSRLTQRRALERQRFRCALCGTAILALGEAGREEHRFGEGAQAHHVQPVSRGGTDALSNCVVICGSCHYTVHEGGNYRFGTVVGRQSDYPHFRG